MSALGQTVAKVFDQLRWLPESDEARALGWVRRPGELTRDRAPPRRTADQRIVHE
jgi:hypothetical protein